MTQSATLFQLCRGPPIPAKVKDLCKTMPAAASCPPSRTKPKTQIIGETKGAYRAHRVRAFPTRPVADYSASPYVLSPRLVAPVVRTAPTKTVPSQNGEKVSASDKTTAIDVAKAASEQETAGRQELVASEALDVCAITEWLSQRKADNARAAEVATMVSEQETAGRQELVASQSLDVSAITEWLSQRKADNARAAEVATMVSEQETAGRQELVASEALDVCAITEWLSQRKADNARAAEVATMVSEQETAGRQELVASQSLDVSAITEWLSQRKADNARAAEVATMVSEQETAGRQELVASEALDVSAITEWLSQRGTDMKLCDRRDGSSSTPCSATEVILVRHGERLDDVDGSTIPQGDPPLSSRGRERVAALGEKLASLLGAKAASSLVISSPYKRCRETADGLLQRGIGTKPVVVDCDAGEVFGPVRIKTASAPAVQNTDARGKMPQWGETMEQAHVRFVRYFDRIAASSAQIVIVVTHGDALAALVSHFFPARTVYATEYLSFIQFSRPSPSRPFSLVAHDGVEWLEEEPAIPRSTCPATEVILVRHGERLDDVDGSTIPQGDPPLSSRGRERVAALGEKLASLLGAKAVSSLVISSPYKRCRETADGLLQCGIGTKPVVVDCDAGEVFGPVRIKTASAPAVQNTDARGKMPQWGETMEQAHVRFVRYFDRVAASSAQTVIVVTHGDALAALVSHFFPARTVYATEYLSFIQFSRPSPSRPFSLVAHDGVEWLED